MPFKSAKQQRYMFSQHPTIAKRFAADAKAKGEPIVQPGASMQDKLNAITTRKHKRGGA